MSIEVVFLRTEYNYDRDLASDESGLLCPEGSSLTKQSFAEECDINTIVHRFGLSGELPTGVRMPTYADFADVPDYHTAMNALAAANEAFEQMPAVVRARFNNDPGLFVDFCSDEKNRDEAIRLGLVVPESAIQAAAELAAGASSAVAPPSGGATAGSPGASSTVST